MDSGEDRSVQGRQDVANGITEIDGDGQHDAGGLPLLHLEACIAALLIVGFFDRAVEWWECIRSAH